MDSQTKKCPLCGGIGKALYTGLQDFLFGTPGRWNIKRCCDPSCRVMWLDPVPTEDVLRLAYESYYTHDKNPLPNDSPATRLKSWIIRGYLCERYGYGSGATSVFQRIVSYLVYLRPNLRQRFDMRVRKLPAKLCGRVLDVGCGSGEWLSYMRNFGVEAEGLEIDERAVNVAHSRGLTVHLGTLDRIAFPENSFDTVTMGHVIEHVPNLKGVLQRCNRILRRGGLLVISTPNSDSFGHRVFGQYWRGLEPPRHLHLLNQRSLCRFVENCGFTVLRCHSFVHSDSIVRQSVEIAKRTRWPDAPFGVSLSDLLRVRLIALLERCFLVLRPGWGEEIYLMARKTRDMEISVNPDAALSADSPGPEVGRRALVV